MNKLKIAIILLSLTNAYAQSQIKVFGVNQEAIFNVEEQKNKNKVVLIISDTGDAFQKKTLYNWLCFFIPEKIYLLQRGESNHVMNIYYSSILHETFERENDKFTWNFAAFLSLLVAQANYESLSDIDLNKNILEEYDKGNIHINIHTDKKIISDVKMKGFTKKSWNYDEIFAVYREQSFGESPFEQMHHLYLPMRKGSSKNSFYFPLSPFNKQLFGEFMPAKNMAGYSLGPSYIKFLHSEKQMNNNYVKNFVSAFRFLFGGQEKIEVKEFIWKMSVFSNNTNEEFFVRTSSDYIDYKFGKIHDVPFFINKSREEVATGVDFVEYAGVSNEGSEIQVNISSRYNSYERFDLLRYFILAFYSYGTFAKPSYELSIHDDYDKKYKNIFDILESNDVLGLFSELYESKQYMHDKMGWKRIFVYNGDVVPFRYEKTLHYKSHNIKMIRSFDFDSIVSEHISKYFSIPSHSEIIVSDGEQSIIRLKLELVSPEKIPVRNNLPVASDDKKIHKQHVDYIINPIVKSNLNPEELSKLIKGLRVLSNAKNLWLIENNVTDNKIVPTWGELKPYLIIPKDDLAYPGGHTYSIGEIFKPVRYGF